jgi:hypothetical protein
MRDAGGHLAERRQPIAQTFPLITLFDLRTKKTFRINAVGVMGFADVYNILNSDTITAYNLAYVAPTATAGSNWLTPSAIATARFVKFSVQVDF